MYSSCSSCSLASLSYCRMARRQMPRTSSVSQRCWLVELEPMRDYDHLLTVFRESRSARESYYSRARPGCVAFVSNISAWPSIVVVQEWIFFVCVCGAQVGTYLVLAMKPAHKQKGGKPHANTTGTCVLYLVLHTAFLQYLSIYLCNSKVPFLVQSGTG